MQEKVSKLVDYGELKKRYDRLIKGGEKNLSSDHNEQPKDKNVKCLSMQQKNAR